VYGGNKYRIYTSSAISFDQTFAEDSYSVKTLHDQSKMFEGSTITKANPASFSFDVPLTIEKDESVVIELLGDVTNEQLKSFDIYVQTGSSTFKLESAVITSGSFDFVPQNQFTVRLEGEGTKLSRVGDESYSIPGSARSESSTRTPLIVYPVITADSLNMNNIISVNLNLQNNIEWTPYENLHSSLSVTNSSNAMFPANYVLSNRILSGEIRQYQQDNNITQFDDFSTNTDLTIIAKNTSGDANFFEVEINPVMYTARMEPSEIYTQSYDYRSLDNTDPVTTQISYST